MAAHIWLLSLLMLAEGLTRLHASEDRRFATRTQCSTQYPQTDSDCDMYETDVFIPSRWNGNYTCANDDSTVNFSLTFGKPGISQLDLVASMNINNSEIHLLGSFASLFRVLLLQNDNRTQLAIFGRKITNFELNGRLGSPSYIDGVLLFYNEKERYSCSVELRREEILEQTNWCNGHGQCYRYGRQKNQYMCCCDQGYTGQTCLTSIASSTPVTSTSTAATPSSVSVVNSTASTASNVTIANTSTTLAQGVNLGTAIRPGCTNYGWDILVDMSILKQLYPAISSSHIYFGDTSCRGRINGTLLMFQQGFRDCLTAERVSKDTFIYENILFYAIHDPIHPFIIRQHNWTFGVECDVSRSEATAFHVHHNVDAHHVAMAVHYNISTSFFKDENFMEKISGNPVNAGVGENIYVKMFTTTDDWTIKMLLHTCFTKPNDGADNKLIYFLIQNGCEVDSTTRIISQTTHETKFVFQNFEYSSNHEGFNVFCNATFCHTDDNSAMCSWSCQ